MDCMNSKGKKKLEAFSQVGRQMMELDKKQEIGGSFGMVTGRQPHEEVGNGNWQALSTQW